MSVLESIEPYGTDIGISATGDLIVTPSGDLGAVSAYNVLAQALYCRIKTGRGELVLHSEYGIDQPIGAKLNRSAIVTRLMSELAELPSLDPRFHSVAFAELPTQPEDGVALEATVIAGGGTTLSITGLPGEARIAEVAPVTPETALATLEEEEAYGEAEPPALAEYNATHALVEELEEL